MAYWCITDWTEIALDAACTGRTSENVPSEKRLRISTARSRVGGIAFKLNREKQPSTGALPRQQERNEENGRHRYRVDCCVCSVGEIRRPADGGRHEQPQAAPAGPGEFPTKTQRCDIALSQFPPKKKYSALFLFYPSSLLNDMTVTSIKNWSNHDFFGLIVSWVTFPKVLETCST